MGKLEYLEARLAAKTTDARLMIPHTNTHLERQRPLSSMHSHFVHYPAGSRVPDEWTEAQVIAYLVGLARYHIQRGWGGGGGPPPGFSLMYHWAIGRNGQRYKIQDETLVTWHASNGNYIGLATLVLVGVGQGMSQRQRTTLLQHLEWVTLRRDNPIQRGNTWGHGETPYRYGGGPNYGNNTDCPGLVLATVRAFRAGENEPMPPEIGDPWTDPHTPFPTGFYVQGGFGDEYRSRYRADPPTLIKTVGYPLTNELALVCEDGQVRTCQVFERAVMEWHPDEADPLYQIQYRRLGQEHLGSLGQPTGLASMLLLPPVPPQD